MQWLFLALPPILLAMAWLYMASTTQSRFPDVRNKRICLLIAHPDDEAMFFAPTLLALTRLGLGNHVKILCLCSGEDKRLTETRKQELVKSAMALGLRKEDDVFVVERPYALLPAGRYCAQDADFVDRDFEDGMQVTWDEQKIADLLSSAFAPNHAQLKQSKSAEQPTPTIDVLITFDQRGVSSHPNHISVHHGARHFIASLLNSQPGWQCPVDLYTLTSVSILRKYTSFVDGLVTMLLTAFAPRTTGAHPAPLCFLSGPKEVRKAQKAMTTGHKSQMVWFRYGWIGLSRYMVVNDLKLEKPPRV